MKKINEKKKQKIIEKHKVLDAVIRKDFNFFLEKAFHEICSGEYKHNFHIDVIADYLNMVTEGKENRIIINMPPRHLKSKMVSVAYVAFRLGQDPKLEFICVSYGQNLADELGELTLKIMESRWYKRIFKKTRISKSSHSKSNFKTTQGGGRIATSTEGALTGMGADIIIVDDPIKQDEAMSEVQRNRVNHWFANTLVNRLNDKKRGAIIIVMQRVHQNDLTGYLLENSL